MKRFAVAALAILAACCVQAAPLTPETLVTLDRVSDPQLSPDGTRVAYTLRRTDLDANKGVRAIWLLDLSTGVTAAATGGSGNSDTPRWAPDGRTLYFLSTRSGSQQVWKLPLAGGEAQPVTKLPLDVGNFLVSPKGDRLAVTLEVFPDCDTLQCTADRRAAREKQKASGQLYDKLFIRHWDSWADGSRSQLFTLPLSDTAADDARWVSKGIDGDVPSKPFGGDEEISFAPNGDSLVFSVRIAGRTEAWSTNFDLYQVPADGSAAPKNLTAANPAWDTQPRFTPDGRKLVYLAMKRAGFEADRYGIMVMDLASGQTREIDPDWDRSPGDIGLSDDGRTVYATADDLGQTPLFAIQLASGKVSRLTGAGQVSGFSPGKAGIVYARNALDAPDDLYLIAGNGKPKKLTSHNADKLAQLQFSAYEPFSFKGWHDETVHGYVVKPYGWTPGKKYPVALIIHGGPQGSMGNDFHYRWNPEIFAGFGYGVVFIDFHGSTGYGQAFTDSISGDWGGKPLEDLKKGWAHALSAYDWLDGSKACALGASYGGYMINWIAGNWPDGFQCLVNHDGIFDNRSMTYTTEELWFDEWEMQGTQFERPANFEKHNPVNHVAEWKAPMLVIQGGQDFRVPAEQGLATFTALQRRGIESQFLYFPDENHWVLKPQNSLQWHASVKAWLQRWIGS